jgi:plasmid stabilization system protein ParE
MTGIIWSKSGLSDFNRLKHFLTSKNAVAAKKMASLLQKSIVQLQNLPSLGKPVSHCYGYRDLYLPFGQAGYIVRYRLYEGNIYILSLRHYREG